MTFKTVEWVNKRAKPDGIIELNYDYKPEEEVVNTPEPVKTESSQISQKRIPKSKKV